MLSRYIFETYQRRHRINTLFEICFRSRKDVAWKTSFLKCIWDFLKTSQKRRLFWDVSKRSLRCLSQWRSDWDISKTSHEGWNVVAEVRQLVAHEQKYVHFYALLSRNHYQPLLQSFCKWLYFLTLGTVKTVTQFHLFTFIEFWQVTIFHSLNLIESYVSLNTGVLQQEI